MARYPDRRSASIPALQAVQRRYGWCSPEGIEQVACVMRLTPGLPHRRRDVLRHARDAARRPPAGLRLHEHLLLAVRRRRAARARCSEEAGDDPDMNIRGFECLGACDIAPMVSVDGVYVGPVDARRGARRSSSRSATAPTRCRPSSCAAARPPTPRWPASHDRPHALRPHRRAGPGHDRRLRAPGRLRDAAPRAEHDARGRRPRDRRLGPARPRRRRLLDGQEGVVHPARRRSTSTSSATPTSPSPARSRTASSCRRARTCSSRA